MWPDAVVDSEVGDLAVVGLDVQVGHVEQDGVFCVHRDLPLTHTRAA